MQCFHQRHSILVGKAQVNDRQIKIFRLRSIKRLFITERHGHFMIRRVESGFRELEQIFVVIDNENFWCRHAASPC